MKGKTVPDHNLATAAELLLACRDFLAYQHALGIKNCPRKAPGAHIPEECAPGAKASAQPSKTPNPLQPAAVTGLACCLSCGLRLAQQPSITGEGNPKALLVIVGDWSTPEDVKAGKPFVGAVGELLDRMLKAIQLDRASVYLTNLVKCPTPDNRPPTPEEASVCLPLLQKELKAVSPGLIMTMGLLTAQTLLGSHSPLVRLRGKFHDFHGIPLLPTLHPSFLLSHPEMKKTAWQDLQLLEKAYSRLALERQPE